MVRPDPAANETDQQPHVGAVALRRVGRKAQGTAGPLREPVAAIGAIEEREPCAPGQRGDLLTRKCGERGAAHQKGEGAGGLTLYRRALDLLELFERGAAIA